VRLILSFQQLQNGDERALYLRVTKKRQESTENSVKSAKSFSTQFKFPKPTLRTIEKRRFYFWKRVLLCNLFLN
jgi:hypothetical protein